MNILLLGGAGFIGTNLALALAADPGNLVTVADRDASYFQPFGEMGFPNVRTVVSGLTEEDFDRLLEGQDVVYHLMSTSMPTAPKVHSGAMSAARRYRPRCPSNLRMMSMRTHPVVTPSIDSMTGRVHARRLRNWFKVGRS